MVNTNGNLDLKDYFFDKANQEQTPLHTMTEGPIALVTIAKDQSAYQGWKATVSNSVADLSYLSLKKGDSIILDFGEDLVGYPSFLFQTTGAPQDAPAHLRLTFGEVPGEVQDQAAYDQYDGWLSSSWLQQEYLHLDNANSKVKLNRRYTFRYLKIEVLDTSIKYQLKVIAVKVKTVTAADPLKTPTVTTKNTLLADIDRTALKTLKNNMQDFFEDAPKRDRRLWLGDFWETTRANYQTYKNFSLSKRCLYLFAAGQNESGQLPGDVFLVNGKLVPDDIHWMTWLLMFGMALRDYYDASKDLETVKDLFPVALEQVKNAIKQTDSRDILPEFQFSKSNDEGNGGTFIDWNDDVNNQAATQAVLIRDIKDLEKLAEVLNNQEASDYLKLWETRLTEASMKCFWDDKKKLFTSGKDRQVSLVSQIWFADAEILTPEENRELLKRSLTDAVDVQHAMLFNQNIFAEMLFKVGLKQEGLNVLKKYYGYMVAQGADAFWEIIDFDDQKASPYGSYIINSYCHGWGSYPSYLIRQYNL